MENYFSSQIDKDSKIAVLCGGMSSEREVSLRSGKNCIAAMHRLGYKNAELIDVNKNIANVLLEKNIEVAYLALHGKYGEDGSIQGLLEILNIPYTGSGVRASSISMSKDYTKRVLKTQGIPIIDSVMLERNQDCKDLVTNVKFPVMVKPASEGSSIGMSKVNDRSELDEALKVAFEYDRFVMLEYFVQGKSMTVGVLDFNSKTFATPILEFRTKTEWYDYEAKYTEGMTEFILPAQISEEITKKIQEIAVNSHKAVGAFGMSRVDFMLDESNNPYVLEINTIPGMTDLSDLPAQSKAMGIEYDALVNIILNSAAVNK
ncbi:MAG: D-alanine--D-alanine ligase [bacterium]